ncbi:MAG: exodeoxyribonuclease III [Candidatus Omnitrophica bacterium]|nr:exodeoxyribonuclease III [Candidatus Omnitrophota bacterium]
MKFVSWNVNGIRSILTKGFLTFVRESDPDVLCVQETRAVEDEAGLKLEGYHAFWNPAQKKGYAGTAVFSKVKPLAVTRGLGVLEHDGEGRVITLEFKDFFLVNVYTPNSQRGLTRLKYRTGEWDVDFLKYVKTLERKKPVVFCGDLNVAHKEIDLARPKDNRRNAGFTDEERASFDAIVRSGFLDAFREFEKGGGHYTWWSYMNGARERNIGWRIDYFLISPALKHRLRSSAIHPEVGGSDHCPVAMVMGS